MAPWLDTPAHARWLEGESNRLLDFARASLRPSGGFSWLNGDGTPDLSRPAELWISCRMTHSFALGHLMGRPDCARFVDHGITSLTGAFHDADFGGWYASVDERGPVDTTKQAYAHAFVVIAASSALAAGRPGAAPLLDEALGVLEDRFRDGDLPLSVDTYDRTFSDCEDYRGVNANMHTTEALLAAADVTGRVELLDRALGILDRVINGWARDNSWRIPEHFTSAWDVELELNRDQPDHPFRPYGATIGHSFEWARLLLQAAADCDRFGLDSPTWAVEAATSLIDAAADTFGLDGEPGFVYTTDWDGKPVVHERMHWVVCEAINATAVAYDVTGDSRYEKEYERYWQYAATYLIDTQKGSWFHELDAENRLQEKVWPGKADIYHAIQATIIPRLPVAPALSRSLADGNLD